MTLIAQLILARPVIAIWSDSIVATRILVAALGVVGLGAIVAMAPAVGVSRRRGLLVAISLAACPLWGPLAATFMTEVPAFAFEMLCLWCAFAGWTRRRDGCSRHAHRLPGGHGGAGLRGGRDPPVRGDHRGRGVAHGDRGRVGRPRPARAARRVGGDGRRGGGDDRAARVVVEGAEPRALSPAAPSGISYKDVVRTSGGFLRSRGLDDAAADRARAARGSPGGRGGTARVLTVVVAGLTLLLLVVSDSSDLTPARKSPFVGNYFDPRGVLADDITYGTRAAHHG